MRGYSVVPWRLDEPLRGISSRAAKLVRARTVSDLLVRGQGIQFPVSLRLGARDAAAFPLRPVDEFWMALPVTARHSEHCRNQPLACVQIAHVTRLQAERFPQRICSWTAPQSAGR